MATAEVIDAQRVTLALGDRVEADDDAACLARGNGKDARAQQPMTHPLDERGIAAASDNVLVNAACFVGAHRLARDQLPVDLELQSFEGGVLGKWKEIVGLADRAAAIDEGLLDLVVEHAVAELDIDVAGLSLDVRDRNASTFTSGARLRASPASWTRKRHARTWDDPPLGNCGHGGQKERESKKDETHMLVSVGRR